ncbi:head-tail connector protein [Anaplasma marginale]
MLANPAFHVVRKAPPTSFPVTLTEVKSFLGINNNSEDGLLTNIISMSSEYAQWYIGQSLGRQTWVLSYSRGNIPKKIYLPFGPVVSVVSVSVATQNTSLRSVTRKEYSIDNLQSSVVYAAIGATKIEIVYEAGYADTRDIPTQIKHGILHHVAVAYKRRDSMTVEHLAFIKEIYMPFREVRLVL